jgi:hypothetical protein
VTVQQVDVRDRRVGGDREVEGTQVGRQIVLAQRGWAGLNVVDVHAAVDDDGRWQVGPGGAGEDVDLDLLGAQVARESGDEDVHASSVADAWLGEG